MKTFVNTYNLIEGFHKYENAKMPFAYLKNEHRHMFEIRCEFKVSDDNREIEFNFMQGEISSFLNSHFGTPCNFGGMSCEMIAKFILNEFDKCVCVHVLEDGYGGATVTK